MILENNTAKRCLTVAGHLVENNKILLVHHIMLDMWLSPGGHVEENELPHRAAEREFFEETGISVEVVSNGDMIHGIDSQFLPNPVYANLHWINKPDENKLSPSTGKRCEQHIVFAYYVKRKEQLQPHEQDNGVDDMKWCTLEELQTIKTSNDIRQELIYILKHHPQK